MLCELALRLLELEARANELTLELRDFRFALGVVGLRVVELGFERGDAGERGLVVVAEHAARLVLLGRQLLVVGAARKSFSRDFEDEEQDDRAAD